MCALTSRAAAASAAIALAFCLFTGVAQAQQNVMVRVTDAGSTGPVDQAQVSIVGTNLGGITNSDGRVTVRGVKPGTHQVRVLRVGYAEQKKTLVVTAGADATLDFSLASAAFTLAPTISTATGEQRRVELGNAISQIDAAKVAETSPISNVSDMLNSRAPGVSVISGTQTGTGSRVRIRGTNSLSLTNEPIYVIDGIRMTSSAGSIAFGSGGNNPSRVGDIDPADIENIEIVKGPSAATLYGTDAANGVIVITTKRGRAGPARWTVHAETGLIQDRNKYPTNYTIAGHALGSTSNISCTNATLAYGTCLMDSLRTYSVFTDPDASPLANGSRQQLGAQVSGGTETIRYFISGDHENEDGVLKLPPFEIRRFAAENTPIQDWTMRPNALVKNSARLNLNTAINPKLDVSMSAGYVTLEQRLSLESNATAGVGSQAFGGPGYKTNGLVSTSVLNPPNATPLNGYRAWTPGYTFQEKNSQTLDRFIGSADAQFRPLSWLSAHLALGTDVTDRVDEDRLLKGQGPPITSTYRQGFANSARTNIRNTSAEIAGTGSWQIRPSIASKTTLGAQYVNFRFDQTVAGGANLSPGVTTTTAGSTPSTSEATTLQKTLGGFVEQSLAFNDRLFVTGALRTDQNSAFGTNFQNVVYPKASLSWIISDESFFKAPRFLDNLRLRAAFGASGVQPGPNDALRTFIIVTPNVRALDVPGISYGAPGNDSLRPERTTEFEAGFEAKLFKSFLSVDLTYYNKRTKDALIGAIIPPLQGTSAATQRQNIGGVENKGWELLLNSQLINRRQVGFDMTLSGSINKNKVLSLGSTQPQIGTSVRVIAGYPIGGLWARRITGWNDKNKDGLITYYADPTLNEVFVADSASFVGQTSPKYIASLTSGLDLFNKRIRLQTLFDYRGGFYWYNNTERIRCVSRQNCNGLMNPKASFEEQAETQATLFHPSATLDGFFQKGDFLRLREVSATLTIPDGFVQRYLRGRSASFTFSGRNIAHWTKYRGTDPETDRLASEDSNNPDDFQTLGPPSYFIFRLNLGF